MRLETRGGEFVLSSSTDGSPAWVTITHEGREIATGFHPKELADLQYAVTRLMALLRTNLISEKERQEI